MIMGDLTKMGMYVKINPKFCQSPDISLFKTTTCNKRLKIHKIC